MISQIGPIKYVFKDGENFWNRSGRVVEINHKTGFYQGKNFEFVKKLQSDFDGILDIGANHGQTTLQYAQKANKIWAFEMQGDVLDMCRQTLELNGIPSEKYELIHCALGDRQDVVKYTVNKKNDGGSYVSKDGTVEVEMKRIDDFAFDHKIDFVKLDVEGCELFVIKGMLKTLESNGWPIVQCELTPELTQQQGYDYLEVVEFMKNLGYDKMTTVTGKVVTERQYKKPDYFFIHKTHPAYANF